MCKDPNCPYCIECANCHHRADEHMCGNGHCFMKNCNCSWFIEPKSVEVENENDSIQE